MITNVQQRNLWTPDSDPMDKTDTHGDCMRSSLASIMGLQYEDTEGVGAYSASIREWLKDHLPGVDLSVRRLTPKEHWGRPDRLDDYKEWPQTHSERGYWMASIWSPRVPDVETFDCGCAYDGDGNPQDPDPECHWCHGKPEERSMGIAWGLHSVVMKGGKLAWDPHPDADPEDSIYFCEALTFIVTDPSVLLP